jgi:hypothetical protein
VTRTQSGDLLRLQDSFKIFEHLYDYAKEKGIYEEYKWAFCKMLSTRLSYQRYKNPAQKSLKLSLDLMKKVNFPEDFKEFATDLNR